MKPSRWGTYRGGYFFQHARLQCYKWMDMGWVGMEISVSNSSESIALRCWKWEFFKLDFFLVKSVPFWWYLVQVVGRGADSISRCQASISVVSQPHSPPHPPPPILYFIVYITVCRGWVGVCVMYTIENHHLHLGGGASARQDSASAREDKILPST